MTIASALGWYSVILLTHSSNSKIKIDTKQYFGLIIVLFLAVGGWFADCLIIKQISNDVI